MRPPRYAPPMKQADLIKRADELEDLIDALPPRDPQRKELKDELRWIRKNIRPASDPSKSRHHFSF